MNYSGDERRKTLHLTDEQIEKIADRVSVKLEERFYVNVGKTVVRRILYIIGAGAVALTSYLYWPR